MCGIAGVIDTAAPDADAVERMLARVVSRGPDGAGLWRESWGPWTVTLGHRRLAVIDIEGGAQPMGAPATESRITYNGEVYSYRSLREELRARGRRFTTRCDTEVVLQHLDLHGVAGLADLDGMFALALWDPATRTLLLARDRAGIKPLYWAPLADGGIAFASELTALLEHPGVGRRLSAAGLCSYLFSDYAHAPLTLVDGVFKLAPGHSLSWRDGRLRRPEPFTPPEAPLATEPLATDAGELWRRLEAAVERHLVSDVPVAAWLSGGIDSSCVALCAQRRLAEPMTTLTVGFRGAGFDERHPARRVAEAIGSRHVEEVLDEAELLEVCDAALDRLDEPIGDHAYLPTYLLARMTAGRAKVVLSGDGGDELWGGYPTYRAHRIARALALVPRRLRPAGLARALDWLPVTGRYQSWDWRLRRFFGRWDDDPVRRHLRWMSTVDLDELARLLGQSALPATLADESRLPAAADPAAAAMAIDQRTYLPGSILAKVDRASMAFGIEVRPPFLDADLVAWSRRQPTADKIGWSRGKLALRRAARAHLPSGIAERRKHGFGMPVVAWMRGPLRPRVSRLLDESPLWQQAAVRREVVLAWDAEHAAGRADHGKPLWSLLVLDHWMRANGVTP